MKIKIRRDASVLEMNNWLEMNGWLAELRDDGSAEQAGHGRDEAGDGGPEPGHAAAAAPANRPTESAEIRARTEMTERAAIGDQLRLPIAWCEMGSCISHHADPAALGEADIRARAIFAGWRVDALGRLACPRCQQSEPRFRASHPVALWDRDAAITRVALMAAAMRNDRTADSPAGGDHPSLWLQIGSLRVRPWTGRPHVPEDGSSAVGRLPFSCARYAVGSGSTA